MNSYYAANCIKSFGGAYGGEDDQYQRLEKEQDPIQRNITILKSAVRELLIHPETATSVPVASATPGSDSQAEGPPSSPPAPVSPNLPQQAEPPKDVNELLDALDILTSQQLPVVKFYDDYGGRPSEMDRATSTQFTELYKGPHGISALLLNDGKTGVITVHTESSTVRGQPYSRLHPEWVGALIQSINVLRPRAQKLILDMSHNTGGYVCLGMAMIQLFFPEHPRLVTNMRLSPLGTQLMTSGAMGVDHFISSYGESTTAAYQNGYLLKPRTHPHRNMTFTDFVSDRCAIAQRYYLHVNPEEERGRGRPVPPAKSSDHDDVPYHPWDPENIAILTDGYCGSSCALITNMLHMKFRVKTVVVGGRTSSKWTPMSYSTFPGLQVIDDSLIFHEMHDVRARMMSTRELDRLERGPACGQLSREKKQQAAFMVKNQEKKEEEGEEDAAEEVPVNGHENGKDKVEAHSTKSKGEDEDDEEDDEEEDDEEEDEDDDLDSFYPQAFTQSSRLRLTWRQIYNTGSELNMFNLSNNHSIFEPAWKDVERWDEFSFFPADHRIDYTDHNVHSVGAIWEDARDAAWGPGFGRRGGVLADEGEAEEVAEESLGY
ncbi:hypothetical protein EMPS_01972 [Entomortierella parvispora]|uniref:Tail specific protease domain-containing protein n=1 Tax=Entomortierella parvispora TaxID=205924 RepID=A0A9P3LTH1_9FUNG|nr:hypothetical protein EMPS_01972 [Entomortierella parvispora]